MTGAIFRRLAIVMMIAAGLVAAPVAAHQLKTAVTEIAFNPRSGQVEIAHRFIIHDAEHAITQRTGKPVNLHADASAREAFSHYVASHFTLTTRDGETVGLVLLGHEVDGGHIWIYQEMAQADWPVSGVMISHTALRETWRDQINLVNLRIGSGVESLVFTGADGSKPATLQVAAAD